MSHNITLPDTFTVSADIFNDACGEQAEDDVVLTRDVSDNAHDYFFGVDKFTISRHEAEDCYIKSMCAQVADTGVLVADDNAWAAHKGIFVLHFGAYGCTHVLSFGSLEDALEDAAGVLPVGMFTDVDMEAAREEMYADGDLSEDEYNDRNCDEVDAKVHEHATTDLTYTESGYLCSWEWTCTEFDSLQAALEYAQSIAK
jgi:hypothetical protein